MIIKFIGLQEIIKEFKNVGNIDMMPAIKVAARKVQNTTKDLVPVDTGVLKSSIKVRALPKQNAALIYTNVEYAPHQEFGTSKMKPQPFMAPAININRAGINQYFRKYLNDQMKSALKGGSQIKDTSSDDANSGPSAPTRAPKRRTRVNGGYRITSGGKVSKGAFYKVKRKK